MRYLWSMSPAGNGQEKVGEEQTDEDDIVDGLVEALVGTCDELLDPLSQDQDDNRRLAAVGENGPHHLLGGPGILGAWQVLDGWIPVYRHNAHDLKQYE